jgi:hypothetical protein
MSLLNTASPWSSSDTKKRIPSIGKRRTQRAREKKDDDDDSEADISESMQSTISQNAERGKTVYDMLNKITSSDSGDDLADFKPVAPPSLAQIKEGFDSSTDADIPNSVPYDTGFEHLSSYAKSYEAGGILGKPYYANKGSANSGDPVMQKLNHITHILEELQMEKTSNITEELILYTFLGVFVIFVVDSFARVGKYHR